MTWGQISRAVTSAYQDVLDHHTLQVAAALSYYFVLSVFPALIFLSAVMGLLPLPDLFGGVLGLMSKLLPADSMQMVRSVLNDVLSANRKAWLSFGMVGTLWVASTAFDAMIEALDIAYDVKTQRPFWKTRILAVKLAAITGTLLLVALAVMIVGPRFGSWLAGRIHLSRAFVLMWPLIHWGVAVLFALIAVEFVYYFAPNVKQRFRATLPGAILAVAAWVGLSYLLGFYFQHFSNYSRMYGALGGFIAFMTWLYWNSFALLVGAELNAEIAKRSRTGKLPEKEPAEGTGDIGRAA